MNWPALIVLVVGLLIGAAWGSSRSHRDAVRWIEHFVSADAGQRSAIRDLYVSFGYAPPDFYADAEPEPRESWWRRVGAWMRGTKVEEIAPEVNAQVEQVEQKRGGSVWPVGPLQPDPDEIRVEPDPLPQTDPHGFPPQPGPKTQPAAAVIDADWAARSAQMLAEAQAAIDAIGGCRR